VVVRGNEALSDGTAVTIVTAAPTAAAGRPKP
jgi:hypothetical protein